MRGFEDLNDFVVCKIDELEGDLISKYATTDEAAARVRVLMDDLRVRWSEGKKGLEENTPNDRLARGVGCDG